MPPHGVHPALAERELKAAQSGPPRDPQPGVNIHPDSRLAQPKEQKAWQGPHPFLQGHGFNGDIHSFNNRVQKAHDGYANAYKQEPSPGVIWDVALAPNLPDKQISDMFQTPLSQRDTKAQQWHVEAQHNGDATHLREDGKIQPTNLLTAWRKQQMNSPEMLPAQNSPQSNKPLSVPEFHKLTAGLVTDGYTGWLPFGSTFWKDVHESSSNPAPFTQKLGYLNPSQALKVATQAQGSQLAQEMVQQGESAAMIDYATQSKLGTKELPGAMQGLVKANHGQSVSRVKVVQEFLKKNFPAYFEGLTPNGIMDRQWMTQYDQVSRTPGAAYMMLKSVAAQQYFPQTPNGIKDMTEAAVLKDKIVNSAKTVTEKWQAASTPLIFYSHNHAILGEKINSWKQMSQLFSDFWHYESNDTASSWLFPVAALSGVFRFAKLGFDEMSGGFNQLTADANGYTTMLGKGVIPGVFNNGYTTKQLANSFADALKQNPDWVHVLGFGHIPYKDNSQWWDQVGNFVVSTALAMSMKGPGYWKIGEKTTLGQLQKNLWLRLVTRLAHSDMKANDLVRAANILGPRDSWAFIDAVHKDIQSGELSHRDFHDLVSRYVYDGRVDYKGRALGDNPNEKILSILHSNKIPKSMTKVTLQQLHPKIREGLNNLEIQGLAHGGMFGKMSEAAVRSTRGMLGLASPDSKLVHIFSPRIPNQLESFLTNHGLASRAEIQDMANKYILAAAHENIPEMESIIRKANSLYREKYPKGLEYSQASEFERLLETENRTYMRFMGGGLREGNNIWEKTLNGITHANDFFNKAGYVWRRFILATGPGLFYKHLARDSIASIMGGYKGYMTADMKQAADVLAQVMREDPEIRRLVMATRGSVRGADLSYMLGHDYSTTGSFNLMDEIAKKPVAVRELRLKAALHLRAMIVSKEYGPFRTALETGNMEPMVRVIMENKEFRHLLNENTDIAKQEAAKELSPTMRETVERQIVHKEASAYAQRIFNDYKAVHDAGKASHIPDVFSAIDEMHWKYPGMADSKVAKYLHDNQINVEVKGGAPKPRGWADRTSGNLVSLYMKPNKYFRGKLFDDALYRNYANMLGMGYDAKTSAGTAVRLAEQQTMYHMLDFSNTLQIEQKFRGFLPFFTKHRLFVKWLAARMAQYPGIVLPASEIAKHLDPYGRINFTFMGQKMNLNLLRLMWLNSQDLPPIIPGAQLIPKAGLPGEYTRWDSVIGMWLHAKASNWSYKAVTAHMDQFSVERLDRYMALFRIQWAMHRGANTPVPETEALKYAMFRGGWGGVTGNLIVNNSFLSPVTFSEPALPKSLNDASNEWHKLLNTNPAKAKEFFDKHPEVGLTFGMTQNFDVYNHVTQYWGEYDKIHSDFMKVEKHFSDQVLSGKSMDAHDYAVMHKAQKVYDQGIQHLLVQDAQDWKQNAGGYPPGQVDDVGKISTYGPWGTLFLHDPIGSASRLIAQFGGKGAFTTQELHDIYGSGYSQMLQYQIDHAKMLNLDSASVAADYDKLKRIEGVYHITGKPDLYQAYTKARSDFENKLGKLYAQAKSSAPTTAAQKAEALYQARELIRQNYENPTIKFDGKEIKVLPFSEFTLTTKTPQEVAGGIWGTDKDHKGIVGYSYSSMDWAQRQFLGLPGTPQLDKAWSIYNYWKASYYDQTGKYASPSVEHDYAIALNKDYPGFWKDYSMAHLPKSYVLLRYAPKAFAGQYGSYWKELVTQAYTSFEANKTKYYSSDMHYFDQYVRSHWPKGFVQAYKNAGGLSFLKTLNYAWG